MTPNLILEEDNSLEAETYILSCKDNTLTIKASDDLGFIYGIYEISRRFLGIQPLWFWNDQKIQRRESIEIPEGFTYKSEKPRVRYRGWFINDEVLLATWKVDGSSELPWEMAFEALLRLGGNMTIPGTDKNSRKYRALASRMGLYITHHHAEPLGAEMFIRAYPDLEPSFAKHEDLFIGLWKDAIKEQSDSKVIWNIGFRGQGDKPFWADDTRYDTPKARGELISKIIRMQYDLVKEHNKDAVCCTNLYGEIMALYRDGHLEIPDDVIRVWADNGYGKMVSRRQNDDDPRVYALPTESDHGRHGIYYHVSFYDLQAANHMTMMPNSPAFIGKELSDCLSHGAEDFWIINCSNIKPHLYYLDLVARLWQTGNADTAQYTQDYARTYYGADNAEAVSKLFSQWPEYSLKFGPHEDNRAGEQFANHITRMLATNFVVDRNSPAPHLKWATSATTFRDQIIWYKELVEAAADNYEQYLKQCETTTKALSDTGKELFKDSLLMQIKYLYYGYLGANLACESMLLGLAGEYKKAFYQAGLAREAFLSGDKAQRDREHDKWQGFYENDCETDIKQSAYVMEYLMSTLRAIGDGPHYWAWQRDVQDPEEDRKVTLLLSTTNHLKDLELFDLMKQKL
ncbi:glycosyl hydrolase 115 family protein [Butyrivibrio sp. FCS006]|uniref:glycosyl hydrolase 115 family protein n=1 Tax=Butyrivibrio sp. FCS006 TaxID=1280684 RepID=UPI0003B7A7A9|nr:glycosyl hydrolase 115 family protein [Butyrivibrio sp. FCS006]